MNDIARRLEQSMALDLSMACDRVVSELEAVCESPIEVLLGAAFMVGLRLGNYNKFFGFCSQEEEGKKHDHHCLVMAQYKWKAYRIDWVIKDIKANQYFFIECDGHEFHERTKEQAERDRSKDRAIQQSGIPILRFTGREIYRDPCKCVTEILNFMAARFDREGRA